MKVVVTGGAGYIGSHTVVELLERGHDVHVVDNFRNSERSVIDRIEGLVGKPVPFSELDILESSALTNCLIETRPDAVIHFAALKSVGESVSMPLEYYRVNVEGTISLLSAMDAAGCRRLVFSSSATVYGEPEQCPVPETASLRPPTPYGRTKLASELVIRDCVDAPDSMLRAVLLRYFNPVGAHPSGLIGELPTGLPNNLAPYITQTAAGLRSHVRVFGADYPTPDGTGVRDFIHVVDLATAHVAALKVLDGADGRSLTLNLGTGRPYSVLEMIQAFSDVVGHPVPYEVVERRAGDIVESWADPSRAETLLDWQATRSLKEICEDAWRWQCNLSSGALDG
ncbi:UDP-glucose 4-epimerase GalE [Stenotrophomonas sp. NRRL B-14846]|uniref:UDP-glucose 4-epimerase GalE n=1 Tax=Stenotrophomonas sp. NRRL B-14846 TaxID=3162882 RepID=UPI003D294D1D